MLSGCGLRDTSQLITPRETSHNVLALFIGACIAERKQSEIAWSRDVGNTGERLMFSQGT